jgi:hypothetical protein
MLLVVTGDVQIGKTRWLQACVGRLEAAGVACEGVLAPGVWREERRSDGRAAHGEGAAEKAVAYVKEGIDNLLLPGHELVPFARRTDLAQAEGTYRATSQAGRASLGWHIDDAAIDRVNAHFDQLEGRLARACGAQEPPRGPRLLFVDELGRLELMHGGGLTSAVGMLARGPRGYYDHAVVVARSLFDLANIAVDRFGRAWGSAALVDPCEETWERHLAPLASRAHG